MSRKYYVFSKRDARAGHNSGCIVWWRAEGKGYTRDLREAGVFTDEDRASGYPSEESCIYVPCEVAEAAAQIQQLVWVNNLTSPYYVSKKEADEA